MGSVDRLTRVNELLKRELAGLLERYSVMVPGVMLVSITMVKCSVDLRNATVYVSVLGGGDKGAEGVMSSLQHNRVELQREIARTLSFKHTPVLSFKIDGRMAAGDRVLGLLNEVEKDDCDGETQ